MSRAIPISPLQRQVEEHIHAALDSCRLGLGWMLARRVAFSVRGPSGAPELLALIFADDPSQGYWYGHIVRHPVRRALFVSAIVWTDVFIDAGEPQLVLNRFHYWTSVRLRYQPCTAQQPDDTYAEAATFDQASRNLALMVRRFDLRLRGSSMPSGAGPANGVLECRLLEVYGLEGGADQNGQYPEPPGVGN